MVVTTFGVAEGTKAVDMNGKTLVAAHTEGSVPVQVMSADSLVNEHGVLVGRGTRGPVQVAVAASYGFLTDMPQMPPSVLNQLKQLSFSTEDGAWYSYSVAAVRAEGDGDARSLEISTSVPGISVLVDASSARLCSGCDAFASPPGSGAGTMKAIVVRDRAALEDGRRALHAQPGSDLHKRCYHDGGACLHTRQELRELRASERGGGNGRSESGSRERRLSPSLTVVRYDQTGPETVADSTVISPGPIHVGNERFVRGAL